MGALFSSPSRYRDLVILLGLAALVTPAFWLTRLDLWAQDLFYVPAVAANPWPHGEDLLWHFLYKTSWLLAGAIALVGVGLIAASRWRASWRVWGVRGWHLLLVVALGCGLVVNLIFKDHYGRQRPRQITPYGGVYQYQPPLQLGEQGKGKSFPCGHCSAGFAFFGVFLIWRHSMPLLAWLSFAVAVGSGALFGVGRMAAGGHFLSDVIWCGFLMYAVAWLSYYKLLNVPAVEARLAGGGSSPPMGLRHKLGVGAFGVAAVAGAMLAKPVGHSSTYRLEPTELDGLQRVEVRVDFALLKIQVSDQEPALRIRANTQGFGLPTNAIRRTITENGGVRAYQYQHEGFYTEKGTEITIGIPPRFLPLLNVTLTEGDVLVSGEVEPGDLRLQVERGQTVFR